MNFKQHCILLLDTRMCSKSIRTRTGGINTKCMQVVISGEGTGKGDDKNKRNVTCNCLLNIKHTHEVKKKVKILTFRVVCT